jgi:hypothetical protein
MIRLGWSLSLATGRGRALLLAACTAMVSGLLLVAVAVLRLPSSPVEPLYAVVSDPGTRGGYVFGTVMLGLPPLLLLFQAVRLGTSARERRLAALRLAGATPGEVRRIGAMEVGLPAFAGAIAGIGVFGAMRAALGGELTYTDTYDGQFSSVVSLRLVPTSVGPAWWQVVLVVLAVTALGVGVGMLAGRRVTVTPLGLTRRTSSRPPRPWGLLVMFAGVVFGLIYARFYNDLGAMDVIAPILSIALLVVGMVSLAPWTAYVVGKAVARRARTAPVLLAARRLVADPRPAGRAAAAVGGIGLVAGGCGALSVDFLTMSQGIDSYYLVGLGLVIIALVVALVVVIGSLTVHSVESLLDRKRSTAALTALGVPADMLIQTQRWEIGLVALPMSGAGALLGVSILGGVGIANEGGALWLPPIGIATIALVLGLVMLAVRVSVRLTRRWTLRAADPANLRTA